MNFGNSYYGDFNASQQRAEQPSNWNQRYGAPRSVVQNYLIGRLIFSPEQITPQEIPTDGTPAIFPLNDGSTIYVKSYQPNGEFADYKYVLEKKQPTSSIVSVEPSNIQPVVEVQNVEKSATYDDLVKRIDFLEQVVNELLKKPTNPVQNESNKEGEKNGK